MLPLLSPWVFGACWRQLAGKEMVVRRRPALAGRAVLDRTP